MNLRGIGNQATVVLLAGTALLASLVISFVLPERFLHDGEHLQLAMIPQKAYLTADSFRGVANIYVALGLRDAAPLAGLLGMSIFVVCIFAAVGWERLREARVLDLIAIAAALLIATVYLGQYSKELVTLAIGALLLLAPRGRKWDVAIVLAAVAYGVLLRPYWLIVAALYVLWRIALPRTRRPALLLLLPVLVYTALQPAFLFVLGSGLQGQREGVNSIRENPEAVASLIQSPLPDIAGPGGIAAALVMLLLLVCPVPLLLSGSVYHLASGLLILGIWVIVLAPAARGRLAVPAGTSAPRPQVLAVRSAAMLFALVLVQVLFEPDFGSYLKHLTPLLPLALTLLPVALQQPSPSRSDGPPGAYTATFDPPTPDMSQRRGTPQFLAFSSTQRWKSS